MPADSAPVVGKNVLEVCPVDARVGNVGGRVGRQLPGRHPLLGPQRGPRDVPDRELVHLRVRVGPAALDRPDAVDVQGVHLGGLAVCPRRGREPPQRQGLCRAADRPHRAPARVAGEGEQAGARHHRAGDAGHDGESRIRARQLDRAADPVHPAAEDHNRAPCPRLPAAPAADFCCAPQAPTHGDGPRYRAHRASHRPGPAVAAAAAVCPDVDGARALGGGSSRSKPGGGGGGGPNGGGGGDGGGGGGGGGGGRGGGGGGAGPGLGGDGPGDGKQPGSPLGDGNCEWFNEASSAAASSARIPGWIALAYSSAAALHAHSKLGAAAAWGDKAPNSAAASSVNTQGHAAAARRPFFVSSFFHGLARELASGSLSSIQPHTVRKLRRSG